MQQVSSRLLAAAAAAAAASSSSSSAAAAAASSSSVASGGGGGGAAAPPTPPRAPPQGSQHFTQPGLEGLRVGAYIPPRGVHDHERGIAGQAVAVGTVIAQLSESILAVDFRDSCLAPFLELGSRVYVAYEQEIDGDAAQAADGDGVDAEAGATRTRGFLMGGLVVHVNSNATFSVLLDNSRLDLAVPREMIALSEGRCRFLDTAAYGAVVEWVASAGITSPAEQHSTAIVLYARGWRADQLFLLETADLAMTAHLSKAARMSIMEKAEWQRDHHRQMRSIYKERVKEKDRRYFFSKYAGILSASVAFCGAFSLFGWNYKNYLKQQRSYQLDFAVKTLTRPPPTTHTADAKYVERGEEERWMRNIFRRLDTAHPRIVVLTGYFGCGKSSLCRTAIGKEQMTAVFVDVRNKEDILRCIIKALGVPNVDACGDPLDFISEACLRARQQMDSRTPILVLKLREGDNLTRIYNEAVALACDRRLCHLVVEVPIESLTVANTSLPRLDFYTVRNFNREQALQYTQHRLDPLDMEQFIETVGTNSNDLDELFAAVHQRRASPTEYANQKLMKAMRQVQVAWDSHPQIRAALRCLAGFPYEEGQHEGANEAALRHPVLRDIVIYNPVQDVWLFSAQVLHTAARCCL